jgi:hypothetical protein
MKSTCESLETTHKQLEHMLRCRGDADSNDMGDSDVVKEKRKEHDLSVPYRPIYSLKTDRESANDTDCNTPGVCHQLSNGFEFKNDM